MIRVEHCRVSSLTPGIVKAGTIFCLFVNTFSSGNAYAQSIGPETDLGRTAGFTELQQRSGDAVNVICGAFVTGGDDRFDESRGDVAQQQILFDKCGEMVHTARVLAGADEGTDDTQLSLGITADELGAAVQNVTGEEIAAAGSLATESAARQSSTVGRRLSSLLSSVSQLQLSSANINDAGGLIAAGNPTTVFQPGGGGAAAADDAALASPFGFYVNGLGATTDKATTEGEDGFEANSTGISLGFDYLITPTLLGGVNLGYTSSTTDFDTTIDVSGGDLDSEQINLTGYGMWFTDSAYVDVIAGFSSGSFDMTRRIVITAAEGAMTPGDDPQPNDGANDTVFADTNSSAFRFGVGGGYEFRSGGLSIAPYGRVSLLSVDLDEYEETGDSALALRVDKQSIESLTGAVGFRLTKTYSTVKGNHIASVER